MKKYEFTGEYIIKGNKMLQRIRALRSFKGVECGDLGGYIESERNLSHDGNAWVGNDAEVYGFGQVTGNGLVAGKAEVCDHAIVRGNARVTGKSMIGGSITVQGDAWLLDYLNLCGQAVITGDAWVKEKDDVLEIDGLDAAYRTATAFRLREGIGFEHNGYYGSPEEFKRYAEYQKNDVLRRQLLKFAELAEITLWKNHD